MGGLLVALKIQYPSATDKAGIDQFIKKNQLPKIKYTSWPRVLSAMELNESGGWIDQARITVMRALMKSMR